MVPERKMSFQSKPLVAVLGHQTVLAGKIAFGKTEVMDGIQQVGLTHTVTTANAYKGSGKAKLLVKVVLELEE
jgi:CO dehydrogenase/acetyl-CoA synthase alpha subunit